MSKDFYSSTHNYAYMSTTFNDAKNFLENKLGKNHNSARTRQKTKSKTRYSNCDIRYAYGNNTEDRLSLAMTTDGGTVHIRISGYDGHSGVFCTFTSDRHTKDELLQMLNQELEISLSRD